jgi:hypothetical protein
VDRKGLIMFASCGSNGSNHQVNTAMTIAVPTQCSKQGRNVAVRGPELWVST